MFLCRGQDATGEEVIKPYTPTTLDSDLGYFELVIKVNIYINFLVQIPFCVGILFDKLGQLLFVLCAHMSIHQSFNPFDNADVSSRENVPSFPQDESW